jgi:hypothetical protein
MQTENLQEPQFEFICTRKSKFEVKKYNAKLFNDSL